MADVILGNPVSNLKVILSPGADFRDTFVNPAGSFDPAAVVTLTLGNTQWIAAISGANALFTATKTQVQAVIGSKPRRARIDSTVAGVTTRLAAGIISIQGR